MQLSSHDCAITSGCMCATRHDDCLPIPRTGEVWGAGWGDLEGIRIASLLAQLMGSKDGSFGGRLRIDRRGRTAILARDGCGSRLWLSQRRGTSCWTASVGPAVQHGEDWPAQATDVGGWKERKKAGRQRRKLSTAQVDGKQTGRVSAASWEGSEG